MSKISHNLKLAFLLPCLFWAFSLSAHADSVKLFNSTTGHTYQRFDTYKSWTDAKNVCITQGGYLATVTSQAENDWLLKTLLTNSPESILWLGATVDSTTGQWKWITNEEFSYINWSVGYPNYTIGDSYLRIYDIDGTWQNWGGRGSDNIYICEWNKAIKTTISMIVGDSDNNGSTEFILIGNNGANNKVFAYDRVSKAVVSNVSFLTYPDYNAVSFSLVEDMNGNGSKEFALLMTKVTDGSSVIQTRDSKTGVVIETYKVPR